MARSAQLEVPVERNQGSTLFLGWDSLFVLSKITRLSTGFSFPVYFCIMREEYPAGKVSYKTIQNLWQFQGLFQPE